MKVVDWTKSWLMKLNAGNCKVMLFGKREDENAKEKYFIKDVGTGVPKELKETKCESDLGVTFSTDLTWTAHVQVITSRANRILGKLKNTFVSRDTALWKTMYT